MNTPRNTSLWPMFVNIIRGSSRVYFVFLPIILLLLSTNWNNNYKSPIVTAQATILSRPQEPATLRGETFGDSPAKKTTGQRRITEFLIVTTGKQIKLYPLEGKLVSSDQTGTQESSLSYSSTPGRPFIVKPYEFSHEDALEGKSLIQTFGNSSIIRLFTERHLKVEDQQWRSQANNGRRASILPAKDRHDFGLESDELAGSKSGYKDPWIVDVDYFFNKNFCLPNLLRSGTRNGSDFDEGATNDCLVIVWLDKNNNLIRLGSVNLSEQPIDLPPTSSDLNLASSASSRVIWLREFSPIDILETYRKQLSSPDQSEHSIATNPNLKIHGFAVSKPTQKTLEHEIHIALSDGSHSQTDRILSMLVYFKQLDEMRDKLTIAQETSNSQLATVRVKHQHHDQGTKASPRSTVPKSLQINQDTGRLYYFDPIEGGRISAFHTDLWSSEDMTILAEDIPFRKPYGVNNDKAGASIRANTSAIAMDFNRDRLYWLTDDNSIYSFGLTGLDRQFVGRLKSKPTIRSVGSMQVFRNVLFIGDSVKKSIIAYELPARRDPSTRPQEDSSTANSIQPTHRAFLVDWPTVLGFRLLSYKVEQEPRCQPNEDVQAQLVYQPLTTREKLDLLTFFSLLILMNLLVFKLYFMVKRANTRVIEGSSLDAKVPV